MKFKERLWQLFLAIVLGVTLSVCDAGLQDDEFDSNALIAGSAIAAGITSGDNWVKIGDFMLMHGTYVIDSPSKREENIFLPQSYNSNDVFLFYSCKATGSDNEPEKGSSQKSNFTNNLGRANSYVPNCNDSSTFNYTIMGRYQ